MGISEEGLTRALVAAWKEVDAIKKDREYEARANKLKAEWDAMRARPAYNITVGSSL